MCTEIQILNGPRIETVGQLWEIIGRESAVFTHAVDFKENDCLCHLDVPETASRSGFNSRSGWDNDGVDFIWERTAR